MNVIQTEGLVKYYGKFKALDGVSLNVKKGEVLGFIGPNGAGKSTTIRILLGLLRKSGGDAKIFGKDVWSDAVEIHKKIAYVPGDVSLWPNLSGGEVIDLFAQLRGGINYARRKEMLERFDLDPTKKCRTYSKGNRQKVALVSAFASDAELFILDEPTSGLDPLMEAVFQECVAEVKRDGKTVLLSSHILAEVERLCDRVSIIRQGRIVESGTLNDLRLLTRTSISIETKNPIQGIEKLEGIHDLSTEGLRANFQIESDYIDPCIRYVSQFGIVALNSTPPTLEELFMRHYGDDLSSPSSSSTKKGARK